MGVQAAGPFQPMGAPLLRGLRGLIKAPQEWVACNAKDLRCVHSPHKGHWEPVPAKPHCSALS